MKLPHLIMLGCAATFVFEAQAEIYKKVDADGHVTYSSTPIKGGKKLYLEPLPTMTPPPNATRPDGFPRVNEETQSRRDDTRRKILEDELETEKQALQQARAALQEAQGNPEISVVEGKTYRNVAKYEEKVSAAQELVDAHEKNVEALKTELANLK